MLPPDSAAISLGKLSREPNNHSPIIRIINKVAGMPPRGHTVFYTRFSKDGNRGLKGEGRQEQGPVLTNKVKS